jgi:hypothetical protein
MVNLNSLLTPEDRFHWLLTGVNDINEVGQIIGTGFFDTDGPGGVAPSRRAFLLTPVPEPTTNCLIVVAAMIFLWRYPSLNSAR